ncbi:MAG: excinuclease ABC subunit UvrC [Chloroflexi bacterium]|nr:excinuclease ABC subunit UvrC [Chloroflexota bacterium]
MAYQAPEHIQQILNNLPNSPGVYQMIDKNGKIIYIGKAKVLRHRVRSYFQPANIERKVERIRRNVADIEIIVLENELMALTVEAQLIRTHKPRYNVVWKDDKRYPYILVHTSDDFPKVEMTRQHDRFDNNRYFGPYSSGWAVRNTLDAMRKAFPYLTCDRDIDGNDERACLYYDIKLCGGPCIGAQSKEEYRENINNLMSVLEGKSKPILDMMNEQMEDAAANLDFERAAMLRDRIRAIERATRLHYQVAQIGADQDVINIAQQEGDALIQLFIVRSGNLISSESFPLMNTEDETPAEMIASFITQFYEGAYEIPPEILVPMDLPEQNILEQWLQERRGKKVELTAPQRGDKRRLVKQAGDTALEQLNIYQAQWEQDTHKQESGIAQIQTALHLENPLNRIECYDISTMHGTATVASRVVFVQGVPAKNEYRRYNINTIAHEGSDDYQSMREVLTRRFRRYIEAVERENAEDYNPGKKDKDETWRLLPDLLIVDGGKGQLGIAVEVLEGCGLLEHVPVVGLAKKREEIFVPGQSRSILLERNSEGLYLIQRIRDEAHRFAISGHRARRAKKGLASRLDSVPGIGPAKRKALLTFFNNDIDAIMNASLEDLMKVPGISERIAEQIKASLV